MSLDAVILNEVNELAEKIKTLAVDIAIGNIVIDARQVDSQGYKLLTCDGTKYSGEDYPQLNAVVLPIEFGDMTNMIRNDFDWSYYPYENLQISGAICMAKDGNTLIGINNAHESWQSAFGELTGNLSVDMSGDAPLAVGIKKTASNYAYVFTIDSDGNAAASGTYLSTRNAHPGSCAAWGSRKAIMYDDYLYFIDGSSRSARQYGTFSSSSMVAVSSSHVVVATSQYKIMRGTTGSGMVEVGTLPVNIYSASTGRLQYDKNERLWLSATSLGRLYYSDNDGDTWTLAVQEANNTLLTITGNGFESIAINKEFITIRNVENEVVQTITRAEVAKTHPTLKYFMYAAVVDSCSSPTSIYVLGCTNDDAIGGMCSWFYSDLTHFHVPLIDKWHKIRADKAT